MNEREIPEQILSKLLQYWQSKKTNNRLPARSDVDPTDIPSLLPYLMLIEVDNGRVFMRLVGTKVATGTDPTGTDMNDTAPPGAYGTHITGLYRRAADESRPIYTEYLYGHPEKEQSRLAQRLILPLAKDGIHADMLLVGQVVQVPEYVQRSLWQLKPEMIHEQKIVYLDENELPEITALNKN